MTPRRSAPRNSQGGYALISVVILVGLTALMVSALLGLLFTSVATQADSVESERELRALDGAMDAAINQLRFDFNSASRDACRLEPPVQRISRMVFDNATPDTGDDLPVDIQCQGTVNSAGGSTADQVRLVGAGGYSGAIPWTTSSWWPTTGGVTVAGLTASRPNLVHRGPAPLQFGTGVTVRNSAAVARDPLSDSPAVQLSGDYVQGGAGPGATDGGCGQLAEAGPMRITDLMGTSAPQCGVPPEDLQLDDDPTDAIAGFRRPIARPTPLPGVCAAVTTLTPGRYNSSDMAQLNRLANRTAAGAVACTGVTFQFTPGVYVFTGQQLVFDRPDSFFVMGAPKGWSTPGGVAAATSARQDVLAELCDADASGVTFVLPPQFRLEHRAGRLSMCPAFSENPGQPPLPAIYQETSYANRLLQLPNTTWSKPFRPSNAAPLSACFNNTLDVAPAPTSGRLDVLDGPGVLARPAASASFPEDGRLPTVGTNQCRVGRTFSARVDTVDPRPLTSARLLVRGYESLTTPANLITDRRLMVTVRRGSNRICTTSAQPGIGNGQWEASIDLMTGSCAVPRSCSVSEGFGLNPNPRCLDPRTGVPFLVAASTDVSNASALNAEQRLTSALLADADLEVTQYLTFSTNFAGFPVFPEQSYTVERLQLVTNGVTTSMLGPVTNGPNEPPFRRGYDNVTAVTGSAGIATPQMPDNSTVTTSGLQTQVGAPCEYLLCPVVVPAGTRPGRPFVHTVELGESSIQIPSEYTAVDIDPNLSSLRLRLQLLPDHCPSAANQRCPFLAPVQLPILGTLDVNNYVRQSYFGSEVKVRVALRVHDGSAVRTRCVETTGILGATTDVSVDLLDVNRIIDGDRLPDDGCDNVEIDSMRDLRLTAAPAASGLNRVGLSVQMQLPCLRDYFANSSWKCVSWTDAGRNVVFQVRPPSIQGISLLVASDTISGAPASSRVTVNARTPATGVSSTSFNVYGRVWMPRSNLDVVWNGDVTEGRPLVRDELVVGALGSQIAAPPVRAQTGIPDADRYLVCCDARKAESRDVKLIARAPSGKELVALVRFTDVIEGEVGDARYFPGYQVEIRDWQTCDEGRCAGP